MMPLTLVALLAIGADPVYPPAMPYAAPAAPVPLPEKLPLWPPDRIRAQVAALALVGSTSGEGPSYLYQPAFKEDFEIRGPALLSTSSGGYRDERGWLNLLEVDA